MVDNKKMVDKGSIICTSVILDCQEDDKKNDYIMRSSGLFDNPNKKILEKLIYMVFKML